MRVLTVRNVHQALPRGVQYLLREGSHRESRNGKVVVAVGPVTTEYKLPMERLVFWPQRDVNTAFLLYEALWMLAGRNDLWPLTRYIKDFGKFSDDGITLHGAYGHRWRKAFGGDQLATIAQRLSEDPTDRRSVLQIWDARLDLGRLSKDLPCNDTVTFQRNTEGSLDMVVFNRSNDIVWGAYFANAAHFSMLQEYLACWMGCPVGRYWQISVNYHAYVETLASVADIARELDTYYATPRQPDDPYADGTVRPIPMAACGTGLAAIERLDARITELLYHADTGFSSPRESNDDDPWADVAWAVLRAHERYRTVPAPERFAQAFAVLQRADQSSDWIASMTSWLARRQATWVSKNEAAHV